MYYILFKQITDCSGYLLGRFISFTSTWGTAQAFKHSVNFDILDKTKIGGRLKIPGEEKHAAIFNIFKLNTWNRKISLVKELYCRMISNTKRWWQYFINFRKQI